MISVQNLSVEFNCNPLFENANFVINNKDKIDFDKWLDTNLMVTWNIKPNYTNLEKGRKKQQKKTK